VDSVVLRSRRTRLAVAGVAALVLAADQATKSAVTAASPRGDGSGLVSLRLVRNTGASFGLGAGHPLLITLTAAVILAVAVALLLRASSRAVAVSLAAVAGGAAGNLADRLFRHPGLGRGAVIDWIHVAFYPATFNLADVAIRLGALIAVIALAPQLATRRRTRGLASPTRHSTRLFGVVRDRWTWVALWIFLGCVVVVSAGIAIVRTVGWHKAEQPQIAPPESTGTQRAWNALRLRYAKGEISREEYLQGKVELEDLLQAMQPPAGKSGSRMDTAPWSRWRTPAVITARSGPRPRAREAAWGTRAARTPCSSRFTSTASPGCALTRSSGSTRRAGPASHRISWCGPRSRR
jgi:signal peptidase II